MVLTASEEKLTTGDTAPDFELQGTDGKMHNLSDINAQAYLIIFMCNHCPYVQAKLEEIKRIQEDFRDNGLVVIGINSNDAAKYPQDDFENMQKLDDARNLNFLYLRDESQEVAKAYGAVCTPDPFLFDKDKKLIFHSRLDDTHGDKPASEHEMHDAIEEYFETGKITVEEQPSMGCNIKWK